MSFENETIHRCFFLLDASSIVNEVIGKILFFYEEILHEKKKTLKKHMSKCTLRNTQIKGYLFTFYAPYAF